MVYASRSTGAAIRLELFLERLPSRASILELGCGAGHDSAAMMAYGHEVIPTDGNLEMAREAEARLGCPVGVLRFDQLEAQSQFHGVWANACLLYPGPPLAELFSGSSDHCGRLGYSTRATRPAALKGGILSAGTTNYPSVAWLKEAYASSEWGSIEIDEAPGDGFDGQPTHWLHVTAIKAI